MSFDEAITDDMSMELSFLIMSLSVFVSLYLTLGFFLNVDYHLQRLSGSMIFLWILYTRVWLVSNTHGNEHKNENENENENDATQHLLSVLPTSSLLRLGVNCVWKIYLEWMKTLHCPPTLQLMLEDGLALYLGRTIVFTTMTLSRTYVIQMTMSDALNNACSRFFTIARTLPFLSGKIDREFNKVEAAIEASLKSPVEASTPHHVVLPKVGVDDRVLINYLERTSRLENTSWHEGRVSGAVYHGGADHLALLDHAASLYNVSNPLHIDLWPSVVRMEAQVIAMVASLLNGGDLGVCGVLTSGGTESILLAAKTHRQWYRRVKNITRPEIIAAVSAHAAIEKACDLLNITLIKVPVDPVTLQMDVKAVAWRITANTIMLYGSAPSFPHGIIDDIEALSDLATRYQVGLHVDACLGGLFLPFAAKESEASGVNHVTYPPWDFLCPGVTSMSVDTHKYGYGAKGTSVVLYRHKALRQDQFFIYPKWTGGLYITPTIAGSRSGALSVTAWTSLVRLGQDTLCAHTWSILKVAREIRQGIDTMEGVEVMGNPQAMVVAFTSRKFNILRLGDAMGHKGWNLNALQHPACLHICVTLRHVDMAETFLKDLHSAVVTLLATPDAALDDASTSAIYGMAASMPSGPVEDILKAYMNITLQA